MNPRALKELSGISYFSFFRNVNGKRFLFLGEFHETRSLCKNGYSTEVQDWLYDLSQEAPECLDLFVETKYILEETEPFYELTYGGLKNFHNPAEAILQNFRNCNVRHNKVCRDNLRFHFVDARYFLFSGHKVSNPLSNFAQLTYSYKRTADISYFASRVHELIAFLVYGWNRQNFHGENLFQYLIATLTDEISNTSYTSREFVETTKYLELYFDLIRKELTKLPDKTRFLSVFYELKLRDIIEQDPNDLIVLLWGLALIPMDLYTLIRMFIVFEESKMQRSPAKCRKTSSPKYIIAECGYFHAKFFNSFISTYFDIKPDILVDNDNYTGFEDTIMRSNEYQTEFQCIKLDKSFDFFD